MSLSTPFERIALSVTDRVANMLGSEIAVVDDRGVVIASNEPLEIGRTWALPSGEMRDHALRVPLKLNGQSGEVIVGAPRNGETISPRLTQVLVELVISQVTTAHQPGAAPRQHELKHKFIHDLLHGPADDEETILREARILGLNLQTPRAVILIDAAEFILGDGTAERFEPSDVRIQRRAQCIIGSVVSFFHLPNDTICAYIGDGEVAVLKASNTQNLVPWVERGVSVEQSNDSWANLQALKRAGEALLTRLRSDTHATVSMGIGRYHPGVCGLARSYEDARAALSLGRRFHGSNGVHCLDALGVAAFVGVSDERTKIDLATHLLSPLDHEHELLETLHQFFAENCCPSSTAVRLSIHRNTLSYRLNKIASLTGLDPRCFDDAVQIRLALLLRALRSTTA